MQLADAETMQLHEPRTISTSKYKYEVYKYDYKYN